MPNWKDADLWTRCAAAGAETPQELFGVLLTDSARAAMAARWTVDALMDNPFLTAAEVMGRTVRGGGEVTQHIATHASEYVDYLKRARAVRHTVAEWRGIRNISRTAAIVDGRTLRTFLLSYSWRRIDPARCARIELAAASAWLPGPWPADPALAGVTRVSLEVYQPLAACGSHPWSVAIKDAGEVWKTLETAGQLAEEIEAGMPVLSVPGEHCGRCPLRSRCEIAAEEVARGRERVAATPPGTRAVPGVISEELRQAEECLAIVKGRTELLRAEVRARIQAGEWIPRWRLEQTSGRRELTVSPEAAASLLGMKTSREVAYSPAELEKLGAPKSILATIVRRGDGSTKLVPASEDAAERAFGGRPGRMPAQS